MYINIHSRLNQLEICINIHQLILLTKFTHTLVLGLYSVTTMFKLTKLELKPFLFAVV